MDDALQLAQVKPALGYDEARDEPADTCIQVVRSTPAAASGGYENYALTVTESKRELFARLGVKAATHLRWLAEGGSTSGVASVGRALDGTRVHALITGRVTQAPRDIIDVARLTPDAKALYDRDREAFYRRCGTSYVASVTVGAELNAVIDVETTSAAERDDIMTQLTAGSFTATGAADQVSQAASILQGKTVHVSIEQRGGAGATASFTPTLEGLRARLDELATIAVQNPAILDAQLRSYRGAGVADDDPTSATAEVARRAAESLSNEILDTDDALSRIETALRRGSRDPELGRARARVEARRAVLLAAARQCHLDPSTCSVPPAT